MEGKIRKKDAIRIQPDRKTMKHIELYDTTLRDGSQAEGISFSLHDKCQLATRLAELGFDFVEGGYPASNDKDRDFFHGSIPPFYV